MKNKVMATIGITAATAIAGLTIYTQRLDGFDRLTRASDIDYQDRVAIALDKARTVVTYTSILSTIGGLVAGISGAAIALVPTLDRLADERDEAQKLLAEFTSPQWAKDKTVHRNYTL